MRALSLWQPWASAIAAGVKTIETRSWSTGYRGPVAIHAAKRWSKEQAEAAARLVRECRAFRDSLMLVDERIKIPRQGAGPDWLERAVMQASFWHRGVVVAVAEIKDVKPVEQLDPSVREHRWGDYSPGRYGWELRNVLGLVSPVPIVGRQGLWKLVDEDRDPLTASRIMPGEFWPPARPR